MDQLPDHRLSRLALQIVLVIGTVVILYYGSGLLLPLTVAGLLAMLLNPLHNKLMSWGLSSGLSITGCMLVLLVFFAGLGVAVGQQGANFVDNWPDIQENISERVNKIKENSPFGELIPNIPASGAGEKGEGKNTIDQLPFSRSGLMGLFSGTLGALGDFLLMLVYIILFLSQKERLQTFLLRRTSDANRKETRRTINESLDVVQKYLRGRLVLIAALAALYSAGFLAFGLDYAVLIALLVAVLSIIPYLGNIIGGLFAVALALAGGGGTTTLLGVLGTMGVAQILESYVLLPLIVGDEVDINPLTTIICVIGMIMVWGPVGAIVAIPLFAILRVICQHVPGLEDYAYLLGQE